MVVCQCGGDLRKLEYTWKDEHTLHKKTVCNTCGGITEWDKFYPDPTMANKRFFHPIYTKGSYVANDPVKIISDKPCECGK